MARTLSVSDLMNYMFCPAYLYFEDSPDVPKTVDYPLLCGTEVHHAIQELETRETAEPRRFYYTTRKAAIGGWHNRWSRALEREGTHLVQPDKEQEDQYRKVGIWCIGNYWDANEKKPRPDAVERPYQWPVGRGWTLRGRIDQVRTASLAWIAGFRPDLVVDGELKPGYTPVVLIDHKTSLKDYDAWRLKENPTAVDWVRHQFPLHIGLQATAYTWLYEKNTGLRPVGFIWYHLRSGKVFPTFREERDYWRLFRVVKHVIENLEAESFPPNDGEHCRKCRHYEPCWEDRYFLIGEPGELPESPLDVQMVPNTVKKSPETQLLLNVKKLRLKGEKPPLVAKEPKPIVLRSTPWNGLPAEEQLKLEQPPENEPPSTA